MTIWRRQERVMGFPGGVWSPRRLSSVTLVQWLDAMHGVQLTSGKVSQWDDLSGQGNHATQTDPDDRPTVSSGALNGRDAVAFTSTQFLNHALRLQVPFTAAFVAYTTKVDADYAAVAALSPGGGGGFIFARSAGLQQWGCYHGLDVNSGQALTTFKRCIVVARAIDDVDLITNGSLFSNTSGASAYAVGGFLGAGNNLGTQNLEGPIAEWIAAGGAASTYERDKLDAYLAEKFAL